ncbi:carbohydrate kinase family protein [Aeromicrobium sp.]|uniref:carbohydrate kinase family protein n=1 Tax=Aeromicrobium sp. TaxID=1871063 RepID=UPI00199E97D8|nr:sugar kinase [Aeromicrobium sp.]MBC7633760.1 sugar kinase [Aeromicrobium sp.]
MVILVVGDVVDDIGVRPLGAVNPASDTISEIRMTPGGSAANVAAWLGHLGAQVRFVGRCGADAVDRHTAALVQHGVDARISGDPLLPTATIVLTLDAVADRTMYVDRAANTSLTEADVPGDVWDDVTWLHVTGYSFFDDGVRPLVLDLVAEAHRRNVFTSIDPSSLGFLEAVGRDAFRSWIDGIDVIFPNLDEGAYLAGAERPDDIADELSLEVVHVVLTCGADGVFYRGPTGHMAAPAAVVDVVDTTGAGDAFCAGFLNGLARTHTVEASLTGGLVAAARCVALRGARPVA